MESFTQAADSDPKPPGRSTAARSRSSKPSSGRSCFDGGERTVLLTEKGEGASMRCSVSISSAFEDFTERCGSEMATYVIGAGDSLIQWRMPPRLKQIERAPWVVRNLVLKKHAKPGHCRAGPNAGLWTLASFGRDAITSKLDSVGLGSLGFTLFFFRPRGARPNWMPNGLVHWNSWEWRVTGPIRNT